MFRRLRLSIVLVLLPNVLPAAPALEVAKDVFLVHGEYPRGGQPDGNSVIYLVADGAIVIDTGRHVAHTKQIADFVRLKERRLLAVINTHWHLDHTGGNVLLRGMFPNLKIYATDAGKDAQAGFLSNYRSQLESAIKSAKPEDDSAAWQAELNLIAASDERLPDHIVESTRDITIGGHTLTLHRDRGATTGDLWIEDRRSKIVVAGDFVTLPVPFFDTACPHDWAESLGHIAKSPFQTLIPGHGVPMNRQQFFAYRDAFTKLLACARSDRSNSQCIADWTDSARTLVAPDELDRIPSMLDYYFQTLLRAPPEKRMRYCKSK